MPRTGHCLCGAISYSFEGDPAAVILCHCDDCQRQSGGAYSVNVVVPRAALEIDGTPRVFHTTGSESGNDRERLFCGECGSPIATLLAEQPEISILKAGTLDDRTGLTPAMEIWHRRSQHWLPDTPGRTLFEGDIQAV